LICRPSDLQDVTVYAGPWQIPASELPDTAWNNTIFDMALQIVYVQEAYLGTLLQKVTPID
jgi:hypothetical protein